MLVQRGTLQVGDIVVAGAEWGRVRALIYDHGRAPCRTPVRRCRSKCSASTAPPEAGDRLAVVENEARAREVTDYRARQKREKSAARATGMRGSLEQMMAQLKTAGRKEFPLVIKADVQGSLEAIIGSLDKLGTDEVARAHPACRRRRHHRIRRDAGRSAPTPPIIGFNVRANKEAREAAEARRHRDPLLQHHLRSRG